MTDFETRPVGEIARLEAYLARRRKSSQTDFEDIHCYDAGCATEAVLLASDIEALIAALTRANAATAAAYEVAGLSIANLEIGYYDGISGDWHPYNGPHLISAGCAAIRAIATPDQWSALDRLIAEAEARTVERIAELVSGWRNTTPMTGEECAIAILAASKKGGV